MHHCLANVSLLAPPPTAGQECKTPAWSGRQLWSYNIEKHHSPHKPFLRKHGTQDGKRPRNIDLADFFPQPDLVHRSHVIEHDLPLAAFEGDVFPARVTLDGMRERRHDHSA